MGGLIYLDHAATTPLLPQTRAAMAPYLSERFGNPSALHRGGRDAAAAVERARRSVAGLLNCRPTEVVFTSGGTESINAALKGVAFARQLAGAGDHIVSTAVEHHAVLHTCEYLEKFGFEITTVPVDRYGRVDPQEVAAAVSGRTVLVSVMYANNEVGTVQPVAEVAEAVRRRAAQLGRRVPFHTDAVQAPGALALDVATLGIDLLSLSAHKFGGPQGVGILHLRRGVPFQAQQSGGGQERQRRAGTENVAGIVGAAVALGVAEQQREANSARCAALRDRLVSGVLSRIPDARFNGHPEERLPNNASFSFPGVEGDRLVLALDREGVAASAGSACGTSAWEPSHVPLAMGLSLELAAGTLRLTVGRENTEDELDRAVEALSRVLSVLRAEAATV